MYIHLQNHLKIKIVFFATMSRIVEYSDYSQSPHKCGFNVAYFLITDIVVMATLTARKQMHVVADTECILFPLVRN